MLVGNDISNAQGQIDWLTYKDNANFVIMKASEGSTYIDTWLGFNRQQARQSNLPLGYYHFARPDAGNTPEQEAAFLCRLLDGDPIRDGETIWLDFEVTFHDPVAWCKAWLDYVSKHFEGMKPGIYLDKSKCQGFDWSPVADAGYPLWLADYTYDPTKNSGIKGKWSKITVQQWTNKENVPGASGVLDGDAFGGSVDEFRALGYKKPQPVVPNPTPPVDIPPVTPPVETTPPMATVPLTPPENATVPTPTNSVPQVQPAEDVTHTSNFIIRGIGWFIRLFFRKRNGQTS